MYSAGGAIYYKYQYLPTIALTLTEAEFSSMPDVGKTALYLRFLLLSDIGFNQKIPTEIPVDKTEALGK